MRGLPRGLRSRAKEGVAWGTGAAGPGDPPRHPDIENARLAAAVHATIAIAIRFARIRIIDAAALRLLVRARPRRRETDSPPEDNLRARRNRVAAHSRASRNRFYPTDRRSARRENSAAPT